ncbi:MAG: hypothetical protein ACSLFK_12455 [Gemmatimonadaceae bacterium]
MITALLVSACSTPAPVEPVSHDMHSSAGSLRLAAANSAEVNAGLAEIRRVTAKFHDYEKAIAAGYTAWSPNPLIEGSSCPTSSEGKMGYHLVNVPLRGGAANPAAGNAEINLLEPEMLLYEKTANGKLRLVGVEYIVFTAAWEAAHGTGAAPPEVLGIHLLASSHTFPGGTGNIDHYELHVWVWSPNPLGMFYPWHPGVSC